MEYKEILYEGEWMQEIVAVVGLGYVGLPVAVGFAPKFPTLGFDINSSRIEELRRHHDRTNEVTEDVLKKSRIEFCADVKDLKRATVFIVTVPTPVDEAHRPDLTALHKATSMIGTVLKKGDMVIYESTVYPGATEEECAPILEKVSGLKLGVDFDLGYSPERINPGDREHTFTNIRKVVSAQDGRALKRISALYGAVVEAGVFEATTIKVAESAKVIENTQRDLNIALINELAIIFHRLGIDTNEVLEAARTKWNFLRFQPGLVGGHCIGVDPYYLTHKAEQVGYIPQVILAGRRTNDDMGRYVAQNTIREMVLSGRTVLGSTVTVLGITFKENCPDSRNTKVIDLVRELQSYGVQVQIADPHAHQDEVFGEYGVKLTPMSDLKPADAVVVAVAHREFRAMKFEDYKKLSSGKPLLIDVKGLIPRIWENPDECRLWRL